MERANAKCARALVVSDIRALGRRTCIARRAEHAKARATAGRAGAPAKGDATMPAMNPSDEELWEACRRLMSDWEPYGERRWHGRREARPDCDSCKWFTELFRAAPDWGVCCNKESPRSGLLTNTLQGCWEHQPGKERRYQAVRPARCDFMWRFEEFLREQAADYIKTQVHLANDPSPTDEPPDTTDEDIRETKLFFVVRRLVKHADEDFSRPAFARMVASARKDTRRYWEFACCFWSRALAVDISEIDLPENTRALEEKFWTVVDATISKALKGRGSGPAENNRKRAG